MMDERRHSVDIPITKTLVALRRVRSLRDPSTNSSSKFSSLVDNMHWEMNASNGINLGFLNGCKDGTPNNEVLGSKELCLYGGVHGHDNSDLELRYGSGQPNSLPDSGWSGNKGSLPLSSAHFEGSNLRQLNQEIVCGDKLLSERYCGDYRDNGLDLTCVTPSSDLVEGVDSCNGTAEGFIQAEKRDYDALKQRGRYRKHTRSYKIADGDVLSRVGSPCLSISDAPLEGCSRAILYGNEDIDVMEYDSCGCGIRSCWSRTPRFRETNISADVEDQPLLSGEAGEAHSSDRRRGWRQRTDEIIATSSERPWSLSQKFRPKSFDDLVGQNVLARSLLSAISNGRISPFYLFHGPHGTGKTSASRIFAAALNCLSLQESRPCGLCQECVKFFSGRSRDVKEVDSVRINRTERIRSLIKSSTMAPVSARFKVFIIDECHLLRGETWTIILNSLESISQHIVFIMITPYLDKLPRIAVSQSQRYMFQKLKEVDIFGRLEKISVKEGLVFDKGALASIAAKADGSLRDAEMMLEQLSLLGQRITVSLVYELIGIVSDDELIDLLDLALSSDTSNTVRRARELLRSRIDPMKLVSQLANLIMDFLAGKCQEDTSEIKTKFFRRHNCEADMQRLSNALKILSETEKQLRLSKNQTTWLTVALLQLSSVPSSSSDANDSRLSVGTVHQRDGDIYSTLSTSETVKDLVTCACNNNESRKLGVQDEKETLESIWRRATGSCKPNSVKNFLWRKGRLSSVCLNQGLAVVELEFLHPDYVAKAEKSWKLIASALQSTLGVNVEIRINLMYSTSMKKGDKVKRTSFCLFSCSRRTHGSQCTTEHRSDPSSNSDLTSEKAMISNKYVETCSSDCASQMSHVYCQGKETIRTIRNSDGNALSISANFPGKVLPDAMSKGQRLGCEYSKEGSNCGCPDFSAQEPAQPPSVLSKTVIHNELPSSEISRKNLDLSIPSKGSSETYLCASDLHFFSSSSNDYINCSRDEDGPREYSKLNCWRTPKLPFKKSRELSRQQQKAHFIEWILHCATSK